MKAHIKKRISWICYECALKLCNNEGHEGATWHQGICDNCEELIAVTEPRDFGGLR
jgi:hypothetical protein